MFLNNKFMNEIMRAVTISTFECLTELVEPRFYFVTLDNMYKVSFTP